MSLAEPIAGCSPVWRWLGCRGSIAAFPAAQPLSAVKPSRVAGIHSSSDRDAGMTEVEPRVLMLIDDEPVQIRLITALAAREGWRTITVKDAKAAIATLASRQGMTLSAI